jgi:hypothetical protein
VYPKKLSFVSPGAKLLLRMDVRERLKVTFAGLKVLERQDTRGGMLTCRYRIAQEGLPLLLPHLTKQTFQPRVIELLALLHDRALGVPAEAKLNLHRPEKPVPDEGKPDAAGAAAAAAADAELSGDEVPAAAGVGQKQPTKGPKPPARIITDPGTLEQLANVTYGCCVATLTEGDAVVLGLAGNDAMAEGALAANAPLAVVCWRGNSVVNVMVGRQEALHAAEKIEAAVANKGFDVGEAVATAPVVEAAA